VVLAMGGSKRVSVSFTVRLADPTAIGEGGRISADRR
jgi:hypothetical protein